LGLKSSWLKSPGLKGLGLKLGFEKSGVEMSFNQFFNHFCTITVEFCLFGMIFSIKDKAT
jgi:hypothetical protein